MRINAEQTLKLRKCKVTKKEYAYIALQFDETDSKLK